jgi:hypothetical protein
MLWISEVRNTEPTSWHNDGGQPPSAVRTCAAEEASSPLQQQALYVLK